MKKLKEHFMPLLEEINMTRDGSIEIKSLEDKIKYEHFCNIFSKYSASYIETVLP